MRLLLVASFLSAASAQVVRDGLVANVGGWDGLSYQASRWEPLCGSLTRTWTPSDYGSGCIAAMDSYSNDTQKTLALYDPSGVLLANAGVGLGKPVCMCFSLSVISTNEKMDICWSFNPYGVVSGSGQSWRNSGKALPRCADVNLGSLQGQWSQTAFMPSYTGAVQTVNLGPSTVTRVETVTLTPTVATFTITSATVFTGSNGQVVTQPVTYATQAAVIGSGSSSSSQGSSDGGKKVGLGIGLGLGIPAIVAMVGLWLWVEDRKHRRIMAAQNGGGTQGGTRAPVNPNPRWAQR